MICRRCHGRGSVWDLSKAVQNWETLDKFPLTPNDKLLRPLGACPDCGGLGVIHCCEGETCQGEENGRDAVQ